MRMRNVEVTEWKTREKNEKENRKRKSAPRLILARLCFPAIDRVYLQRAHVPTVSTAHPFDDDGRR